MPSATIYMWRCSIPWLQCGAEHHPPRSTLLLYINTSMLCHCAAGPVEFRSSNGTVTCDARYVQLLAMQTATADGGSKAGSKGKAKHAPGRTQRSELLDVSLAEEDVAKVRMFLN